ncbi:MAG: hypothetical protein II267_05485, partial [Paludibacteraceae bacterium]|nr:hypothetical protein [Paludibacteraceae bacterium]
TYHEEIADSIVDTNYETKVLTLPLVAASEDGEVIEFNNENNTTTKVENTTPIISDDKYYNLLGAIVDEKYEGIYILNGRKYIKQ